MATIEITKKLLIYHTLYRLNLSFSNIVSWCTTLRDAGLLKSKDMRLYQGLTQELQSEINELLMQTMHDVEFDDWTRFGKVRIAEEKRLRGSGDSLPSSREKTRPAKTKTK